MCTDPRLCIPYRFKNAIPRQFTNDTVSILPALADDSAQTQLKGSHPRGAPRLTPLYHLPQNFGGTLRLYISRPHGQRGVKIGCLRASSCP